MSVVRDYYNRCAEEEWERLDLDAFHRLEFRATMQCLHDHVPPSGLVLDAGGGPGRYTRELCRLGYEVVLLDLTENCVALAQAKLAAEPPAVATRLRRAEVGDIRDLSRFADRTFDAVLCLGGPLSHTIGEQQRKKALAEFVRVAAPGAPVILSVIGYYAVMRVVLSLSPIELSMPEKRPLFERGDHLIVGSFPEAHLFRPEELQREAKAAGLHTVELRACEGLSSNLGDATNALQEHDDGRWEQWLEVLDARRHDPAVVATSEHFLYVGRTRSA